MSGEESWEGIAGEEVRKCVVAVHRAKEAVEEAQRELKVAYDEHAAAERDFNTAKRVYYASQQDQERRMHALRVTPQKQEWLKALAVHDVFGAGEMRKAAEHVGWQPSDNALRSLASDYKKAGYLIGVSYGVVKLNRDRIVSALGPIFDDVEAAANGSTEPNEPEEADFFGFPVDETDQPSSPSESDEDDDPPF